MIRLLIVDDHALFREGLREILINCPDITFVDEACDGGEALTKVLEKRYDVMLLDIGLPGRNGIDILKQVRDTRPELRVIVLSMYPENQYAFRAIKNGASGYLTKNGASRELIKAIRKVASGSKYISSSVAEQLAKDIVADSDTPPHKRLSNREFQVMCLIAAGKGLNAIAKELSLSASTISTLRSRLLAKMNMTTNADVITYCVKNDLLDVN